MWHDYLSNAIPQNAQNALGVEKSLAVGDVREHLKQSTNTPKGTAISVILVR
jgi:hypothetical protein